MKLTRRFDTFDPKKNRLELKFIFFGFAWFPKHGHGHGCSREPRARFSRDPCSYVRTAAHVERSSRLICSQSCRAITFARFKSSLFTFEVATLKGNSLVYRHKPRHRRSIRSIIETTTKKNVTVKERVDRIRLLRIIRVEDCRDIRAGSPVDYNFSRSSLSYSTCQPRRGLRVKFDERTANESNRGSNQRIRDRELYRRAIISQIRNSIIRSGCVARSACLRNSIYRSILVTTYPASF